MTTPTLPADLTRLLQILSGTSGATPPDQTPTPIPQPPPQHPHAISTPDLSSFQPYSAQSAQSAQDEEPEYEPPDIFSSLILPSAPKPQPVVKPAPVAPKAPVAVPSTPTLDPSSITTYPAGLKYVMKHLAPNPAVLAKLKRMKAHQTQHEHQWKAGRDAILKKHASRSENSQKLEAILASLPTTAHLATSTTRIDQPSPKAEENELKTYDLKVYRAAEAMIGNLTKDLRSIGVPFFCGGKGGKTKAEGGEMDPEALADCRRKILEILEDLSED